MTSSILDPISSNNIAVVTTAVAEPAIVVSAPKSLSGKNQSNVTVATFTHANGVEPASAFVATINWGDGTTSTGTITESGIDLHGERFPHLRQQWLAHGHDHRRGD